ncbi:MAG: glycosyltransferase family 4 protein [Pseudomonadota bacterium]
MTIAFFAPLKPPDHPVPSGDRTMARALLSALAPDAEVVSTLRLYDGRGNSARQADLMAAAKGEVARLLASPHARTWRAWLTYHNYYKAPDLIGPRVTQALDIPYIQIESSRARKRLVGPWAQFAHAAEAASDAAHTIFFLTEHDRETLARDAPAGQHLRPLAPFLDRTDLPAASNGQGAMLSVGMMRTGDKLASYTLIADTLKHLPDTPDWQLDIAGDGPERAQVDALMAPFGARIHMHGALDSDALASLYARARLLLWPGVNEAFGLTYLEAQAAGVPVIAQDRPGVRDVVHGPLCATEHGPQAMADRITHLLTNDATRREEGAHARAQMGAHHLLGAANATLRQTLDALT